MLVLTRPKGKCLILLDANNKVLAKVYNMGPRFENVRIGIDAEPSIRILREELLIEESPSEIKLPG